MSLASPIRFRALQRLWDGPAYARGSDQDHAFPEGALTAVLRYVAGLVPKRDLNAREKGEASMNPTRSAMVGEVGFGPPKITSMNGRTRFPGDVRANSVTRGGQEIEKVPHEG